MSEIPYRPYPYELAAGATVSHAFNGNFMRFIECGAELEVKPYRDNGGSYSFEPLPLGLGVEVPEGFDGVTVKNTTAAPVTYRIALSRREVRDSRFTAEGSISVRGGGGDFDDDGVIGIANVATLITAANANRTAGIVRAGAADLWLGNSAAVTATGEPTLKAGEKMTVAHTTAIYGIRSGASSVNAGFYEETAS